MYGNNGSESFEVTYLDARMMTLEMTLYGVDVDTGVYRILNAPMIHVEWGGTAPEATSPTATPTATGTAAATATPSDYPRMISGLSDLVTFYRPIPLARERHDRVRLR